MSARSSADRRRMRQRLFGGRATRPCCFCGRPLTPADATLEHVLPLSLGGGWGRENLRLSCQPCNNERNVEDFEAFRAKKLPLRAVGKRGDAK